VRGRLSARPRALCLHSRPSRHGRRGRVGAGAGGRRSAATRGRASRRHTPVSWSCSTLVRWSSCTRLSRKEREEREGLAGTSSGRTHAKRLPLPPPLPPLRAAAPSCVTCAPSPPTSANSATSMLSMASASGCVWRCPNSFARTRASAPRASATSDATPHIPGLPAGGILSHRRARKVLAGARPPEYLSRTVAVQLHLLQLNFAPRRPWRACPLACSMWR